MPQSGPFPIAAETTDVTFHRATEVERGLKVLAHYLKAASADTDTDDELYQGERGWQEFNREAAAQCAGELIHDVLSYVHEYAGGSAGVQQALGVFADVANEELTAAAQEALPSMRLTQLDEMLAQQNFLLRRLSRHLGIRTA